MPARDLQGADVDGELGVAWRVVEQVVEKASDGCGRCGRGKAGLAALHGCTQPPLDEHEIGGGQAPPAGGEERVEVVGRHSGKGRSGPLGRVRAQGRRHGGHGGGLGLVADEGVVEDVGAFAAVEQPQLDVGVSSELDEAVQDQVMEPLGVHDD